MDAHTAVIGVGTMGSMALWQLARQGIPVLGIEQFEVGHELSASGGESRIFRTAYVEGPSYIPLLQRSLELWRELEAEADEHLLTLTGGLTIGPPDSHAVSQALAGCKNHDLTHEVLDNDALRRSYPQHLVGPEDIAVLDPAAGVLRPERAILAATRAARARGARIVSQTRVTRLEPVADGVRIHADDRSWVTERVIVTVGPWAAQLMPRLYERIVPHRLHLAWHPVAEPAAYAPSRHPVFLRETPSGLVFGFPCIDGATVKTGLHETMADFAPSERVDDPDALKRRADGAAIRALGCSLATYLSGLDPVPTRVSTYMDGYTPSGDPVIAPWPESSGSWVLGGFSGHGFKMAPAIGQLASELVTDTASSMTRRFLASPAGSAAG
ncbi:N-methyl-L-tryptophan oxidase [Streptomyces sp. NPDC001508]|uniref:N-methyl-L-tryptophan oxidase n=1 Tax=Streptomyces sp. NPDC001508 TaxID=3154656 RepID=UPI00333435CD